ncbi:protein-L-isoaspartate(D-aspartate) O-methyltransferase [Sphingosinithalassobacter sp. CS137]|uniref:protein-L-isoaspartate(D-aspartate) O-methyltransferase n=1 Tax=Sphingosinithalassobacter sp. CS137 TaxID=2762748 RepID=UPI00165E7DD1|nr:protein-L-isoaspartate(D-aspartate) O-methyltransferase [Sphingosinithalassobacter sp. CS137]
MRSTPDFEQARATMVDRQIAARGIRDERLLAALREVPRERFVSEEFARFAYEDGPLPIEAEQTISQPYIVAHMIEEARVAPGQRVLEVGAGSGYAAAVLSRIADQVFAIERHAELAELARQRLKTLGYDNAEVRAGDGTKGWPEEAPFDAILIAAGGPQVPEPLKAQLAIGGRLVMPLGSAGVQKLIRVTRRSDNEFDTENLGDVRFVPLIGAHGWSGGEEKKQSPVALIRDAAEPLPDIDDPGFGAAFDRFGDARVVLLGEASHGTSEFYRARAAITKRLIEKHGFTMVAVEADWPDAAAIDAHVRQRPNPGAEPPFQRFPTWMWRNREFDDFVGWLREHNATRAAEDQVRFHGLDLYNLNGSIRAVIDYLDSVDPEAAAVARERYGCLTPWRDDPARYGRMAVTEGYARCEAEVVRMLRDLVEKQLDYAASDGEAFLDATQNARLIANAEAYYRVMYYGAAESWNLRDEHMFDTLELALRAGGEGARAVVWAHNSHIGDARHTDMGRLRDELNLGQLAREKWGDEACLIGFGTHGGTVAAATDWDGPMEVKRVNPSREDSYERLFHDAAVSPALLDLRPERPVREALCAARLERFIGVIYRPETERWSHYSEAVLPEQFDGWVWFDETRAVTPLAGPEQPSGAGDETWPFGL